MTKEDIKVFITDRYPIFEWVNGSLYFRDKRIYISALKVEKIGFMKPSEVLITAQTSFTTNYEVGTFSLTIDQNGPNSILFIPLTKTLPDDLCAELYECIPNLRILSGNGIGYEKVYDKVDILRRHTLKKLIDE